jgi:flap endonuclease-1
MRRRLQREMASARGAMETKRLSRLARLTPLIASYESLSEGEKVEVATSLQNITKDFPVDQRGIDEDTCELEGDRPNTQPHHSQEQSGASNIPNSPPHPVAREDSVASTPDEIKSDPGIPTITTKPDSEFLPTHSVPDEITSDPGIPTIPAKPGSELPPTQSVPDQAEEPLTHSPSRVSSMLAALYSGFLASVQQMGVLLSPRTVLPRPEEQDDETEITQELSQAQRRLVVEEESIWKQLSEGMRKDGAEGDVASLARELEDKSAKILTSYERRNNPPTSEVYNQCRIILQALGVPCINAKGGVEGEALAAAIVRDKLADYVASEDTVSFSHPFDMIVG